MVNRREINSKPPIYIRVRVELYIFICMESNAKMCFVFDLLSLWVPLLLRHALRLGPCDLKELLSLMKYVSGLKWELPNGD